MSKPNVAAQIRQQYPNLAADLRAQFQILSKTATDVDTITTFACGSPDAHESESYENLLEILREKNIELSEQIQALGELMFSVVMAYESDAPPPTPQPTNKTTIGKAELKAVKNFLES